MSGAHHPAGAHQQAFAAQAAPRRLPSLDLVAVVAAGGGLGGFCRWGLGTLLPDGGGFPWTTFAINVLGSTCLALLPWLIAPRRSHRWALFLGTGVLGGFTTLSTASEQTRELLAGGESGLAAAYLLGTLAACLIAVRVAQHFTTAQARQDVLVQEGDE